jgi:hypothetical protein
MVLIKEAVSRDFRLHSFSANNPLPPPLNAGPRENFLLNSADSGFNFLGKLSAWHKGSLFCVVITIRQTFCISKNLFTEVKHKTSIHNASFKKRRGATLKIDFAKIAAQRESVFEKASAHETGVPEIKKNLMILTLKIFE